MKWPKSRLSKLRDEVAQIRREVGEPDKPEEDIAFYGFCVSALSLKERIDRAERRIGLIFSYLDVTEARTPPAHLVKVKRGKRGKKE